MLRASLNSLCLACLSVCALAQEVAKLSVDDRAARMPELANKFYQPLIDGQWAQGLVVGVIDECGPRVFGFGRKSEKGADAPDGDSVFEIGSVSKVFTGILLADMAQRGLVSVDDPVNKLLPDDIGPLQCAGREMRLVDLATHTSGLPRMPPNWAPKDPAEPYVDYTEENLLEFLRQQGQPAPLSSLAQTLGGLLAKGPKQKWEYSNLAVGMLGTLLARKAGQPYEQLVVERICSPLQMQSTRLTLDEALSSRLIAGHYGDGNPAKNWKFGCLGPAGGICSSANDMLKFLAANLEPNNTPLAAALAKAQEPHYTRESQIDMGMNWLLLKPDLIFHNGMTGGYNSFVAFSKPHKLGVVVLADTAIGASGLLDRVSMSFIKALI
jgi:serine-type D-Ala-D-Ala carboxypeptidase/endopeptidase